jgi:hypothetical protein
MLGEASLFTKVLTSIFIPIGYPYYRPLSKDKEKLHTEIMKLHNKGWGLTPSFISRKPVWLKKTWQKSILNHQLALLVELLKITPCHLSEKYFTFFINNLIN